MKPAYSPLFFGLLAGLISCQQNSSSGNNPTFEKPHSTLYFSCDVDTFSLSSIRFYEDYLHVYDRKRGFYIRKKWDYSEDTLHISAHRAPVNLIQYGEDEKGHWQVLERNWTYFSDSSAIPYTPSKTSNPYHPKNLFEDYLFIDHKSARGGRVNDSTFVTSLFPKYEGSPLSEAWIEHKMRRSPVAVIHNKEMNLPIKMEGFYSFHPFAENPMFTANPLYIYMGYAHSSHLIRYHLRDQKQELISLQSSVVSAPFFELDSVRENSYRTKYYQSAQLGLCILSHYKKPKQWVRIVKKSQPHRDPKGLINPLHTAPLYAEISNANGTQISYTFLLDGAMLSGTVSFLKPPYLYVYNRKKSHPNLWAFDRFPLEL